MTHRHCEWLISPTRTIDCSHARLIGILNVTPDSFSDGGTYADADAALDAALLMIEEGASIIDIGGESTRPGAHRITTGEQLRRVLPVVEKMRRASDVAISIDTTLSQVARAALDAGADIINDVSAGLEDPAILELAAERSCGLILMHRLRKPDEDSFSTAYAPSTSPQYDDVVADVARFLRERADAAIRVGGRQECIVLDPGLGFGKSVSQNYQLIARISELASMAGEYPLLFAASRKSFLSPDRETHPKDRVAASVAAAVAAYLQGVRLFRVHDVAAHRDALAAAARIDSAALHKSPPIG